MSSHMDRLSQIVSFAKSKKVTDYKKAIKQLLELWDDNSEDVLEQITENSKNPDLNIRHETYSWNDLFVIVHDLFISEIERISKLTGNSGKLDKERITKLVYSTAEKANYFLKPNDVVISTLQVLQIQHAQIYSEFYEIYLSILRKYVLQKRSQRTLVNHNHWQELLHTCSSILQNVITNVDYVKLLETVDLIVQYGCTLSTLLFETKKLLPIIGNLLENYQSYNIMSTDILFKLTYTVCHEIATDSRFTLCKFGESIPLSMIDLKGPEEKYKLYLLLVQVHHPNGSPLGDDVSYTYNDDKWKAIINLLYKMILNDLRPTKLSENVMALGCEGDVKKLVDLVNDRDPERAWPIIQISTVMYTKYPDCLNFEEYVEFLEIIIKLMNQSYKNFSIMESLCELATVFLYIEEKYEKEDLKMYWDKIWDAVLRYLSIAHNEIVQKGCLLVQSLITSEKMSNPNSFLKLYLTKSIQLSEASVQMLKIFCEIAVLPNDVEDCDMNSTIMTNNSIKVQLLQWTVNTLNRRLTASSTIGEYSKMLIGFTLKSWYKPCKTTLESNKLKKGLDLEYNINNDDKSITAKDIERCYLSLKLKTSLPLDQNHQQNSLVSDGKEIDNPHVPEDLDFLVNGLLQIIQANDVERDLSSFIIKTALMAKIISDLKVMKMMQCNFEEFCLVNELKICLSKIFDQILTITWSKKRLTLDITKSLILLYQTKYDTLINDIIVSSTSLQTIKKIYAITKLNNDEDELDTKISQCKINAVMILALYCCMDIGTEISDSQIKIINTLLKIEKYSISMDSDVISVVTVLDIMSNISNTLITEEFTELVMNFIMKLFEQWQKDNKINECLLYSLPKFLDKLLYLNDKDNIHNILLICKLYHDQFSKGKFGQLAHLSLVKCLNSIVKNGAFHNAEIPVLKQDTFITFVKSPYYLVRLESLSYVYSIFSMKELEYSWKMDFFDKLSKAVYDIFIMQRELTNDDIKDEKLLRNISVIQILATIMCSKSIFQSSALLTLLRIMVDKAIDADIVKEMLQRYDEINSPSNSIIEENLNFLLTSWCQIHDNLNCFPYTLLNCLNTADFLDRYVNVIFPVLIRQNKIIQAHELCNQLGSSFEQVFKNCCAHIIPWALTDECAQTLQQMQDNVGDYEEIGSFTTLIEKNLQQVIIQSVQRLHDLSHFFTTFDTTINLPASDPPHYKSEVIDQCFDRLIEIVCGEKRQSVFYFVITRKPSTIQKILLHLTSNIYSNRLTEFKAKAFHQYAYFCSKIAKELQESYCDSVSTYFVKDISYTLLNLSKGNDRFIAELACKYLYKFFVSVLPQRSTQVSSILSTCVKILVPLIRNPDEKSVAKDVLVLLLKEQKHCLADAIENLGNLPSCVRSEDDYDLESEYLEENLHHFLKSSDDKSCSIDNLLSLKRQLSKKRSQLEVLYERLELTQGFAEHCASSVLHKLVYRLVRLTESADPRLALEAAKCLGVIGPGDLNTMILHPQETQRRESVDKPDMLTYKACQVLADLVVGNDIELRRVSSSVLYAILDSPWGARLRHPEQHFEGNDRELYLRDFLYPFKSTQKASSSSRTNVKIDHHELEKTFDQDNPLWSQESNGSYSIWIANITSAVANCLSNFYSKNLIPIFKLNVNFCEMTLPRLVSLIVHVNSNLAPKVCHCINRFFNHHFSNENSNDQTLSPISQRIQDCIARDAIRCMLNIVNHLRIQTRDQISLDFDYLPIAMAAQFCSAYFSSVLYAELWCWSNLKTIRDFDSIPIIDQIYEQENKQGKIVQDILKEAYIKIGDSDSIHGCGSSHLQNRRSRISYYTNFQKLDKLIVSHDVELSVGNPSTRGMVHALKQSSLHYLANRLLCSTPMQVDLMDDLCYDSLWRLSDWNQITNLRSSKKIANFDTYHYEALKCLHQNDNSSLTNCLEQAHFCIIKDLRHTSLESCKAIYPKLSQLKMLREIEELNSTNPDDYNTLLLNWKKEKYICNNNFQYIEPIFAQRAVMFNIREPLKSSPIIKKALINFQLETSQLAQQEGQLNVAARALETLSKDIHLDEEAENRLLYYEARLAWMRKDEDMARFNLRSLIRKTSVNPNLLAKSLRVYGNWIAENKSENPQIIISKYYEKAIETYLLLRELSANDLTDRCKTRAALAQFAHEQYLTITEYMKSPQFESLKECIDYSRNAVKNVKTDNEDIKRVIKLNTTQSSNDSVELENIQRDRSQYLSIAIINYLSTLQDSDKHDFLIFRLVSLWLDNTHEKEVDEILEKGLNQIPSYKFIPLVPQLAPHMSNIDDSFTIKIGQVLERCAKDHPHHTLPILLALKNLYNDSKYCGKKITKEEPRVLGAKQLIQQLLSTSVRPIIQEMNRLSDALVMLAYFDLGKNKAAGKYSINRNVPLNGIKDFQHSVVPTLFINVKKNADYVNIISVKKYESSYSNVGGINAPKKIVCIGSDGIERPQLVKGRDDLRQDAVMQQVFTVMNTLLKSHKDAKHRKLHIRTYKVVPLTQRSGVLQWCENTLPLSLILTGEGQNPGLHKKYYPNDYAAYDCRRRLHVAKTASLKYNIFMDCCKNLRPAFHHFFTENYLSPEIWFERRLAYTRSIATTSIIGYILGLGDRHVSNILIDKSTAEVIHIDFGIAFEQGKVLPTPETVPFRLTRDIEIAMGVSGVEGTMRRCCEETMAVLREQREIIVTLLKVLLYDPLYSWAITPAKAATYQSDQSSRSSESKDSNSPVGIIETNKLAERALLRVQQKLQGIEEGVASSIAGQVERLIQQARDPTNLSRLFAGWQAYL